MTQINLKGQQAILRSYLDAVDASGNADLIADYHYIAGLVDGLVIAKVQSLGDDTKDSIYGLIAQCSSL